MAVGAKKPQISETVVVALSIDVIEFQGNRLAVPFVSAAGFTRRLLDPLLKESALEVACLDEPPRDQKLLQGSGRHDGSPSAFSPSLTQEMRSIETQLRDSLPKRRLATTAGLET
jgi:hypothetical protein